MDEIDIFADNNVDETETTENTESFGKEIAKTIAVSAASTAGVVIGFTIAGAVVSVFTEARKRRHEKKAETDETETTEN